MSRTDPRQSASPPPQPGGCEPALAAKPPQGAAQVKDPHAGLPTLYRDGAFWGMTATQLFGAFWLPVLSSFQPSRAPGAAEAWSVDMDWS